MPAEIPALALEKVAAHLPARDLAAMNQVSVSWHNQAEECLKPLRDIYENVRASIKLNGRPAVSRDTNRLSRAFEMTVGRATDIGLKPMQKLEDLFPDEDVTLVLCLAYFPVHVPVMVLATLLGFAALPCAMVALPQIKTAYRRKKDREDMRLIPHLAVRLAEGDLLGAESIITRRGKSVRHLDLPSLAWHQVAAAVGAQPRRAPRVKAILQEKLAAARVAGDTERVAALEPAFPAQD